MSIQEAETVPLATLEEGRPAPEQRIKDATSARSLLSSLLDNDQEADVRRAEIQGAIDGNPPYKDADITEMGLDGIVINVNWGHAEGKIDAASIPYFDTLTSVPKFVTLQTEYGTDKVQQAKWSRIIEEKLHRTLSRYSGFLLKHQLTQRNIVIHGVGCLVNRDPLDWQSQSIPPSSIVVPPRASIDWLNWEYCFILDEFYTVELYKYVRNKEIATKNKWDVDQCWKAMENASETKDDKERTASWLQDELKNNSLMSGERGRSKTIRVAHLFVREFSGKVSHYIFERDNSTEWLAARVDAYDGFDNAFTIFFSNIGNGFVSGVRGLGQRVYKWAEAIDRVNNAVLEGAIMGSSLLLETGSMGDVSKLQTMQIGPMRILPPGTTVKPVTLSTNLQGPMAVAQFFQGQESENISSFLPTIGNPGQKRNGKQLEMEMGEKAQLANTRFEIYMNNLDIYYAELYRRISNPNLLPEDPGGREALAFQKACIDAGVPPAALLSVTSVKATRSIGQGSSSARIIAMKQISEFLSALPEDKRNNVIRDSIAAIGGQQFVENYAPDVDEHPIGVDASIAALENNAFMQGGQVVIDPNQNHYIHASIHLKFFADIVNAVREQSLDPRQAVKCLQVGGPHLLLHLKYLEQDPTRKDQFDMLNQQTSELMKMADQIAKFAKRLDEQEQENNPKQPQLTPEMAKVQAQIQLDQQKAQADIELKKAKADQLMKIKDLTAAQRLQITNLKAQQETLRYRSMEE